MMVREKDIQDRNFMVEVLDKGSVVSLKKDPENDERMTMKLVYNNLHYYYFTDGVISAMKEVEGEMPDFKKELGIEK